MKKVLVLKEFVDASDFNKRYEKGKEYSFEDERAKYLLGRGLVEFKDKDDDNNHLELTCENVTTLKLAKDFLRANGIEVANSATLKKVIEIAAENNISFKNLPVD